MGLLHLHSKTDYAMTDLKRSIFVIPCSSLDELPKRMGHELAQDFLTAWTSQWDPRLLSSLGCLPEWKKADGSSMDLEDALIVCPQISSAPLDQPLRERLQFGNCVVVDSSSRSRDDLVSTLLAIVAPSSASNHPCPLLLGDFYALGYAVLQIQILARVLRYSWNIDWIMFTEQAISAAHASLANDAAEAERWLQTCFDSLSQERDRYCSQQAYLLDVVLLAGTTLGPTLERQLDASHPFNLIASAGTLRLLKVRNEDTFDTLSRKVVDQHVSLVGGLEVERKHSYLSASGIIRNIGQGIRSYADLGAGIPKIFSRYQPGFTSTAPIWLTQFGFTGSLLSAWSDGTVPSKDQAKIQWQSNGEGKSLDTVIGFVLDASRADSYIDLAELLSKQLDYHHVPTLVLAHWPGISTQSWSDLLKVVERTPALGKFLTAESYFASTSSPYSSDSFPSNAFKLPIPITSRDQNSLHSQIMLYEQLRVQIERLVSLNFLWVQVANKRSDDEQPTDRGAMVEPLLRKLDAWFDTALAGESILSGFEDIQRQIDSCRKNMLSCILETLQGSIVEKPAKPSGKCLLVVNPSSHAQRLFLNDIPGALERDSCTRIYAAESYDGKSRAIVDIPPFGFARIATNRSSPFPSAVSAGKSKQNSIWSRISGARAGIAQKDWTLANEFMEIQIDPKRGHLRSLFIANKRGSRLSGMVSIVGGGADVQRGWREEDCFNVQDVELRIKTSSPLVGAIEVTANSKQKDGRVVRWVTCYTLWKGARGMDVEIVADNLDPETMCCVWRTAWLNEGSSISAWQNGIKGKLPSPLQSKVELIEIDDAEHRIYIAPRGLSAHRRLESRFLISQFPLDSSGKANVRFSIGLDWPRPYETALDQCDTPWIVNGEFALDSKPDSGAWLAQCSLPNVHFFFADPKPVLDESQIPANQADVLSGHQGDLCLWVQETQGKSGTGKLSFFRDVAEAWRVDSQGREFDTLTIIDGQIHFSISALEQSRILLRWKPKEQSPSPRDESPTRT
jgi:hypothetical protein